MHIKEIYRIWEETDFKDNGMKKSFERSINNREMVALLIEEKRLKEGLEEISEADCIGEVSKTLRQYGLVI